MARRRRKIDPAKAAAHRVHLDAGAQRANRQLTAHETLRLFASLREPKNCYVGIDGRAEITYYTADPDQVVTISEIGIIRRDYRERDAAGNITASGHERAGRIASEAAVNRLARHGEMLAQIADTFAARTSLFLSEAEGKLRRARIEHSRINHRITRDTHRNAIAGYRAAAAEWRARAEVYRLELAARDAA